MSSRYFWHHNRRSLTGALGDVRVPVEVRGDESGPAGPGSPSSKGARTLDKLSGGEYIRGLGRQLGSGRRHLDKISGGELLRSSEPGSSSDELLLRSLMPYALRGLSSSVAGRGLDKISGGEYIRTAGLLPPPGSAKRQAPCVISASSPYFNLALSLLLLLAVSRACHHHHPHRAYLKS
ncbi:hypothetical protein HPB48_004549 [Haemaphysalis longicornis]|uniref:Uncharacterized protein n=1 Tax=Haemaphysalis longicornis TaxID=44386 RepID=A0A9J6GU33_HAELO|nr:hypothetical protein HPB48_004549 [Haemaphysalis longicornis]